MPVIAQIGGKSKFIAVKVFDYRDFHVVNPPERNGGKIAGIVFAYINRNIFCHGKTWRVADGAEAGIYHIAFMAVKIGDFPLERSFIERGIFFCCLSIPAAGIYYPIFVRNSLINFIFVQDAQLFVFAGFRVYYADSVCAEFGLYDDARIVCPSGYVYVGNDKSVFIRVTN